MLCAHKSSIKMQKSTHGARRNFCALIEDYDLSRHFALYKSHKRDTIFMIMKMQVRDK